MVLSIVLLFFIGEPAKAGSSGDNVMKRVLFAALDFLPSLAFMANLTEMSVPELLGAFRFFIRKIQDIVSYAWEGTPPDIKYAM